MGRVKPARKNGTEMCPGCTEEARVNDKGESARHWDILENLVGRVSRWLDRLFIQDRYPVEPGEVVAALMSHDLLE